MLSFTLTIIFVFSSKSEWPGAAESVHCLEENRESINLNIGQFWLVTVMCSFRNKPGRAFLRWLSSFTDNLRAIKSTTPFVSETRWMSWRKGAGDIYTEQLGSSICPSEVNWLKYKDSYAANRGLLGGKQRNKNRAQGEMPQRTGVQGEEGDGQEEAREGHFR